MTHQGANQGQNGRFQWPHLSIDSLHLEYVLIKVEVGIMAHLTMLKIKLFTNTLKNSHILSNDNTATATHIYI